MTPFAPSATTHELLTNPIRWAGRHLAFYGAAALVTGVAFVGIAYFAPVSLPVSKAPVTSVPASSPKPAPAIEPGAEDLADSLTVSLANALDGPLEFVPTAKAEDRINIAGLGTITAGNLKAVLVRDATTGKPIGAIRVIITGSGETKALAEIEKVGNQFELRSFIIPTSKFSWTKTNGNQFVAVLNDDVLKSTKPLPLGMGGPPPEDKQRKLH